MSQWKLLRIGADYETLSKQLNTDPVIVRIMCNRGMKTYEEMNSFLYGEWADAHLHTIIGATEAVTLIEDAINNGIKTRIIGDYDIDGICATTILVKSLQAAGLDADYVIPHRIKDGYGLNTSLIQDAYDVGVKLVITCDNGISAHEAVAFAKEMGMRVLITDHHEVMKDERGNEILPNADIVINPKQKDHSCTNCDICGALVAFLLVKTLHEQKKDLFNKTWNEEEMLELAAFATIGDVMGLVGENRMLVKYGLSSLRDAKNMGLHALIAVTGNPDKEITAYQVGFVFGPCINATGRLDTAERAIKLLLSQSYEEALKLAEELKLLNEERKLLTAEYTKEAMLIAEKQVNAGNKVLVLYLQKCHESIAGIIAGRVKEAFYRPTLVITDAKEELKGSARSIEEYSMYVELSKCHELFTKYGGHPMAAGFSLNHSNLPALEQKLNQNCMLNEEDFNPVVKIDIDLPFAYVNEHFLTELRRLEPFGNMNPRPVFAQREVTFLNGRVFGKNRNCASYHVRDKYNTMVELKFFGDLEKFHNYLNKKFSPDAATALYQGKELSLAIIFFPELNEYRGKREIQFIMQDYS